MKEITILPKYVMSGSYLVMYEVRERKHFYFTNEQKFSLQYSERGKIKQLNIISHQISKRDKNSTKLKLTNVSVCEHAESCAFLLQCGLEYTG